MTVVTNAMDLRALARRRLPRAIFDYADGGAYDELTLRRNRADLEAIQFRQRVMIDVSALSCETTILGTPAAAPLVIAPTGLAGLFWPEGEICGRRAASAFGIPFCLSTMSICAIEDVWAATQAPFWFQLYVMKDRGFTRELIGRAEAAQCPVIVLTLDLTVQGQRHRDTRNGLTIPPRVTLRNALDLATKLPWAAQIFSTRHRNFGNLAGKLASDEKLTTLAQWIATQFDLSFTWKDIAWLRSLWPGKLVLKGILDAEDARRAVEAGADAIVVSNHGGRQLDGARSSISVLPEVAAAVGGRTEILFDGGVMSGQDVLKALALGARGCLIGKAYLYALGARGEAGVSTLLEIMRRELLTSMAMTGAPRIESIGPSVLAD